MRSPEVSPAKFEWMRNRLRFHEAMAACRSTRSPELFEKLWHEIPESARDHLTPEQIAATIDGICRVLYRLTEGLPGFTDRYEDSVAGWASLPE